MVVGWLGRERHSVDSMGFNQSIAYYTLSDTCLLLNGKGVAIQMLVSKMLVSKILASDNAH